MRIHELIVSRTFKDFSSLFFSNILQKLFGLVREPIIAYFFGSSLLYAHYLLLKSGTDFISHFSAGNALKSNLLPKFTKIYESYKQVSLKNILIFSKKAILFLFFFSQLLQSLIIIYLDTDYTLELIIISVLLSITICFSFVNAIYFTIMQSQGRFYRYSIGTTLNEFIVVSLIYPFIRLLGIFGLLIVRIVSVMTITISYIIPMHRKSQEGYEVEINRKDFNFPIMILGNFANIIIVVSRFVSGSDGSNNITYFAYSIFILNALLTAVIANISTLLLKKISIKKDRRMVYYSLVVSVLVGMLLVAFLHYFSDDLIELIYKRGAFNSTDVQQTSDYLYELSYSFILIFIATTLFQPFFTLNGARIRKYRNWISIIFISSLLFSLFICSFLMMDIRQRSLIFIYSMSFISVLLAIYSYITYEKLEDS